MSKTDLKIRLKIELPDGVRLGYGKIDLLRAIDREQSISAAARSMGMSYRRAWMLLEELNKSFATPVVETRMGGAGRGGASLTGSGMRIIAIYDDAQTRANEALAGPLRKLADELAGDPSPPTEEGS
ncbi:winged helix-turn-helix domain-containing protein [Thalassospira permensis]|uniref:HTH lysR-type domain-containing protein n=1 Tax=Thalassospira permensis NBRC 106175 TaxID=1353532 RepID=A0ABR4TUN3_9PROT|nr:LysR family transcriptional regulator [Thalassospira permensis]KEO59854.1 hypothetical protein SMB34_02355 [Thalassospira permensis NBRC 106175]